MKREALLGIAVTALLYAGAAVAADDGAVKSLNDLDGGTKDYHYIYPHVGVAGSPRDAYSNVPPVHQAPYATPLPVQADVPIDKANRPGGTATDTSPPR